MSGYSQTPLWKKLGLRADDELVLLDPPAGWRVPELPAQLSVRTETGARGRAHAAVLLAFTTERTQLKRIAGLSRRIHPDGALWIAWPRRAGGHQSDIREQDIREAALALGLVDVKVAALDEDWSGLRLVWRRERRGA